MKEGARTQPHNAASRGGGSIWCTKAQWFAGSGSGKQRGRSLAVPCRQVYLTRNINTCIYINEHPRLYFRKALSYEPFCDFSEPAMLMFFFFGYVMFVCVNDIIHHRCTDREEPLEPLEPIETFRVQQKNSLKVAKSITSASTQDISSFPLGSTSLQSVLQFPVWPVTINPSLGRNAQS